MAFLPKPTTGTSCRFLQQSQLQQMWDELKINSILKGVSIPNNKPGFMDTYHIWRRCWTPEPRTARRSGRPALWWGWGPRCGAAEVKPAATGGSAGRTHRSYLNPSLPSRWRLCLRFQEDRHNVLAVGFYISAWKYQQWNEQFKAKHVSVLERPGQSPGQNPFEPVAKD